MNASPSTPEQRRSRKRQRAIWVRSAGIAIGAIGLVFAIYALVNAWDGLADARLVPPALALAVVAGVVGMVTIGLNWIRILRLNGESTRLNNGMRWYFVGQLGKYIPGGLWAVLGRGELATRGGVKRITAYTSVGMSLATTYAAAATIGALLLAIGAPSVGARMAWLGLSVVTVAAAVIGLAEPMTRRISALARRIGVAVTLPSMTPRASLLAIGLTIPAWLCIGIGTAQVGRALGFSAGIGQVIAATSYSWLAGFLVVPVPGGLGVREAAFIALYPGPTDEAAAVAIAARVLFILVDLTGAALSTVVEQLQRSQRKERSRDRSIS